MIIVHIQVQKIKIKNKLIIKTKKYILTFQKAIKVKINNNLKLSSNKILMKITHNQVQKIKVKNILIIKTKNFL